MTSSQSPLPEKRPTPLLRRADQATVAVITLFALVSVAGYWIVEGGHRGRLIEIDRSEPLQASFQVDVNTADFPELMQMPGIGPTLARRIVESREQDGDYLDQDDLRRVRGIGPKTLDQIRPYLLPMPDASDVAGP